MVGESSTGGDVRRVSRQSAPKSITGVLGELNSSEKYFLDAFFLSIALGFVYGLFNRGLYRMASRMSFAHYTAISTFAHNLLIGIISALTGGTFGLLANFITFAAVAGALETHASLLPRMIVRLILALCAFEPLELGGFLCFAIVGFTCVEKLILKTRTMLRVVRLLILGTVLLFVAAVIEASVIVLLAK